MLGSPKDAHKYLREWRLVKAFPMKSSGASNRKSSVEAALQQNRRTILGLQASGLTLLRGKELQNGAVRFTGLIGFENMAGIGNQHQLGARNSLGNQMR